MSCCQRCFNIAPADGVAGVYTLEHRSGENVWFFPDGTRIADIPANAALLAQVKAVATVANEVLCD